MIILDVDPHSETKSTYRRVSLKLSLRGYAPRPITSTRSLQETEQAGHEIAAQRFDRTIALKRAQVFLETAARREPSSTCV